MSLTPEWKFDPNTGICVNLGLGAVCYVDISGLTRSGGLRCMGPWFGNARNINDHMFTFELVGYLEGLFSDSYVVLGDYEVSPSYEEHAFSIRGIRCGFLPYLSGRSIALGLTGLNAREWRRTTLPAHRSGIDIAGRACSEVDLAVIHPETFRADWNNFSLMHGGSITAIHPPRLGWTAVEVPPGKVSKKWRDST